LNPVLSVDVLDDDGDLFNVTFMTNASGSWEVIGWNASVPLLNGSYSCVSSVFGSYGTVYWWCVNASDLGGLWVNSSYSFTTVSVGGNVSPVLSNPVPANVPIPDVPSLNP